jgi:hypothetical protein
MDGFFEVLKVTGPEGVVLGIIYLLIKAQTKAQVVREKNLEAKLDALGKQVASRVAEIKNELNEVRASISKIHGDSLAALRERVAKLEARAGYRGSGESTTRGRRP